MESLTTAASIKPTTVEKLDKLQEFYVILYKKKEQFVGIKTAEKLLALLLSVVTEKTKEIPKSLTPVAKRALELFYYFLVEDNGFQDALEKREATELAQMLKLPLHLKDSSTDHKKLAGKVAVLLCKTYPRFAPYFTQLDSGEIPETPNLKRLIEDDHLVPEGNYYDTEAPLVVTLFKTDVDKGLTNQEAAARREKYGTNSLPEPPPKNPVLMFFLQFVDFMVILLLIVTIVTFGFQDYIEGAVLLIVILVNVTIGFVQEYKAERALQALKMLTIPSATLIRDGLQQTIAAADLVPGDLVVLDEGNQIPADLRLVEVANLQVIESVLTGESVSINKVVDAIRKPNLGIGERKNMCFMGTTVTRGRAKGVVVKTGKSTEVGAISKALSKSDNTPSLLQQRLSKLGKILVALCIVLCLLVVGIGCLRVYLAKRERGESLNGKDAIDLVKIGINLAVSVIPEGLVAVTTVTMALGVQRMAKQNVIVRKLAAVETIGSLTTVCSDKTGTLTEGKMKTEQLWTPSSWFSFTGSGVNPLGEILEEGEKKVKTDKMPSNLQYSLAVCALCNNSSVQQNPEKGNEWEGVGDPTEVALTVAAIKGAVGKQTWLEKGWKFLGEIAFDSDRKRMAVAYKKDKQVAILVKGAPKMVFAVCSGIDQGGEVEKFSEKKLREVENANAKLGSQGLRVLALAYKVIPVEDFKVDDLADQEKDLILVGLAGLIDPPRKEVRGAIENCKRAGMRVCMITGDQPRTAFAIACTLGITEKENENAVVTGAQLDALGKGDLAQLDPFPTVFAGVSPSHKLKIINALKLNGEICAMTGDGVNDAPAIKNANVGIAMGKTATDLTKDSAAIILTDDNFVNIVAAIKEGRRTYDNIQKFILYLLACNSAEIWVMLLAVIIGLPFPFTPMMILWANLIADIPPAMALGIDAASPDILERKPRNPKKGIFTPKVAAILLFNGLSMAIITLVLFVIAIYVEKYEVSEDPNIFGPAKTVAFVTLTSIQLFHSLLSKSPRNTCISPSLTANRWALGALVLSLVLLIAGVYIPGLNEILNQTPLEGFDWVKILAAIFVHFVLNEIFKVFYRLFAKRKAKKHKKDLFFDDL